MTGNQITPVWFSPLPNLIRYFAFFLILSYLHLFLIFHTIWRHTLNVNDILYSILLISPNSDFGTCKYVKKSKLVTLFKILQTVS